MLAPGRVGSVSIGIAVARSVAAARASELGAAPPHPAEPERTQVGLGQIEHAYDVRRQRQHDVGFVHFLAIAGEQPADQRQIAEAGQAAITVRSSSRISPASMFVSPSFNLMSW